jgi:transcriptional regulator with XRE-family HTH domain
MQLSAMEHLPPPGERLPLGDLLRRIREGNSVSVERLAQESGKSEKGLKEVEAGALSLSLRQLGTILGALRTLVGPRAPKRRGSGPSPADLRYEFLRRVLGSAEFPREDYLRFLADRLEIDMELLVASPFLESRAVEALPKQTLAESLRELRSKSKLSLEQLAERLHLSVEALDRIERGHANLSLRQLGDLLEAFAKHSPSDAATDGKAEEARLLDAFRRLDSGERASLLDRMEQPQGAEAVRASGRLETASTGPIKP